MKETRIDNGLQKYQYKRGLGLHKIEMFNKNSHSTEKPRSLQLRGRKSAPEDGYGVLKERRKRKEMNVRRLGDQMSHRNRDMKDHPITYRARAG